jgi:transposase-like protein
MAQLSFSSLFKRRATAGQAGVKDEMVECPRCGRFFHKRGHEHEPLCKDCWKLEKSVGNT